MKAITAVFALALAAACSAEADDYLTQEDLAQRAQALATSLSRQIENKALVIGVRRWKDTTIQFVEEPAPGALPRDSGSPLDSADYAITRHGPISDGDIVSKLYGASEIPLSPAEIWLALDEDDVDDLPSELAAHHLRWAPANNRTSEFLRFKADDVDLVEKYIGDGTWFNFAFPPIPAHHYQYQRADQRQSTSASARHTCSEARSGSPVPHDLSGSALANNTCYLEHYQFGWVRHGMANGHNEPGYPAAPPAAVVVCGGNWDDLPNGPWYCQDPLVVNSDQAVMRDSTVARSKTIAITYSYSAPKNPQLSRIYAASARVIPD